MSENMRGDGAAHGGSGGGAERDAVLPPWGPQTDAELRAWLEDEGLAVINADAKAPALEDRTPDRVIRERKAVRWMADQNRRLADTMEKLRGKRPKEPVVTITRGYTTASALRPTSDFRRRLEAKSGPDAPVYTVSVCCNLTTDEVWENVEVAETVADCGDMADVAA